MPNLILCEKWIENFGEFLNRTRSRIDLTIDGEGRCALHPSGAGRLPLFQNAIGERLGLETGLKRVIPESCKLANFPELCDRV
jgi:hypothetical protein